MKTQKQERRKVSLASQFELYSERETHIYSNNLRLSRRFSLAYSNAEQQMTW
jgi:hypothetical protein